MQNNRRVGGAHETLATLELERLGYKILENNFRCRIGEIDIIALHKGYLVFIEVKYRKNTSKGSALEAVTYGKQQKICKVSDYYRMIHHCSFDTPIRYDVIAIEGEQIQWIQNAFEYCNRKAW